MVLLFTADSCFYHSLYKTVLLISIYFLKILCVLCTISVHFRKPGQKCTQLDLLLIYRIFLKAENLSGTKQNNCSSLWLICVLASMNRSMAINSKSIRAIIGCNYHDTWVQTCEIIIKGITSVQRFC